MFNRIESHLIRFNSYSNSSHISGYVRIIDRILSYVNKIKRIKIGFLCT